MRKQGIARKGGDGMEAEENAAVIPEELPGQMAFFPEEELPPAPAPEKRQHTAQMQAPDLSHPPLICILLCDILSQMGGALPTEWLYDITVTAGHINYFLYEDVIGFLLENNMAAESKRTDGTPQITLLEKGAECAKLLRLYVPKLYRDRVLLTALRYASRKKAMEDMEISCVQTDPDWSLCVCCKDQKREMFRLQIHAPSKADAEMLGERILRNPAGFFGKVLEYIMHNEEEQFDLSEN